MCGTQQESWRSPGGSQEAPARRYASKIPPFCEEVFWILCPNCKPWHSRQDSANFDRGGGLCCRQVVQVWTGAGWHLRRGPSRPVPGGGAVGYCVPFEWSRLFRCLGAQRPGGPPARRGPHFSREMGRKRAGGKPPGPPLLWPARSHSLVLAWWGALFRSMGYYGAHLRALIWDASSCRAAQPGGFPLGGSCHRR